MKKFMSILTSLTIAGSLLTGCGGTSDESSAESDGGSETQSLVIWGAVPEENGPAALIDSWNELHPEWPAEYVRFTNDDTGNTKLDTAILSGEQIDLIFSYSNDKLAMRAEGGMLAPLDEFGAEEFINENVVGGTDGILYIDDQIYGIPTAKEVDFYMINQDKLDEKGITIDNEWDVDEFIEIAGELSGVDDDGQPYYGTHAYYNGFPLLFAKDVLGSDYYYKEGGTESNFDAPEFQYLTKTKEIMDKGYSMPFEEIFSRQFDAYCHPAFLNEEVAMMPASTWMIRYVLDTENYPHDFITSFAQVPTTERGVENNYQGVLNNTMSICNNSQNKEAAWEFMKYWITDGSEYMLTGGKIPVWNQVDEEKVVQGILGENPEELFDVESFKEVVFNPDLEYIVDKEITALPEITQILKEESQLYFLGETTEEEYFDNLKQRSDDAINAAQ